MQIVVSGSPASHLRLMQERATSGECSRAWYWLRLCRCGRGCRASAHSGVGGAYATFSTCPRFRFLVGSRLAATPPDVYPHPHGDQSRSDADPPRCEIAEYAMRTRNTQNMTDPELVPGNAVASSIRHIRGSTSLKSLGSGVPGVRLSLPKDKVHILDVPDTRSGHSGCGEQDALIRARRTRLRG